ncbi:AMP-binding protein [Thalassotalea hakodatensis]|uniref:AMP-binding protein n=1 Tax=Thalassotalea hakodatensis TaxID=3030492 RepID=UPI00257246CD|nr:AMP-binding protein [Thalassotalea hakodatensis]
MKINKFIGENPQLFSGQSQYSSDDFLRDIEQYRRLIKTTIAKRSSIKVMLYDANLYRFLVRFLALGIENVRVILPPNEQIGTLENIAESADYTAGNISINDMPSIEGACLSTEKISAPSWPESGEVIFFTSGTSGKPKAIIKDWTLLNKELLTLEKLFPMSAENVFVSTVSHQHIYGLLFRALLPLKKGNTVYQTHEFPEHIASVIRQHKHVVLVSSPAFLSRLVEDNVIATYQHHLHVVFCSGGKLETSHALSLFEQFHKPITQIYGSTESGGIAYRHVCKPSDELWQLFPGVECDVESSSHRLLLHSPFVKEETIQLDDICQIEQGKLRLLGRIDRTIKLEEKRVNLTHMEQVCCQHEWTESVKLFELKQQRTTIAAVVVLSPLGKLALAEQGSRGVTVQLKIFLQQYFERVTLPRKWRFVEHFPYNTQGKLPMIELEKLFV